VAHPNDNESTSILYGNHIIQIGINYSNLSTGNIKLFWCQNTTKISIFESEIEAKYSILITDNSQQKRRVAVFYTL